MYDHDLLEQAKILFQCFLTVLVDAKIGSILQSWIGDDDTAISSMIELIDVVF